MNLDRFVAAQATTYATALAELMRGRKQSHWMWWIFPQLAGLGHSAIARHYGIVDLGEAEAYLAHPVTGPRLLECVAAVTNASGKAEQILGSVDALKLRSSMTLFAVAAGAIVRDPAPFEAALARFFAGEPDAETLRRLAAL